PSNSCRIAMIPRTSFASHVLLDITPRSLKMGVGKPSCVEAAPWAPHSPREPRWHVILALKVNIKMKRRQVPANAAKLANTKVSLARPTAEAALGRRRRWASVPSRSPTVDARRAESISGPKSGKMDQTLSAWVAMTACIALSPQLCRISEMENHNWA
ncbi:unnamed protein product, partial [Cladocopium goreaui]